MIKSTNKYEIFHKHPNNRALVESNVLKIVRSIQIKNLLEFRPILIDKEMRIIDGQHRLEAAKRLNLPVFYEISNEMSTVDIILLNDNQKGWGREDYLNYYCNMNFEHYLKLRKFIKDQNINLPIALAVIARDRGGDNKRETYSSLFKNGKFTFPEAHEEITTMNILKTSSKIIDYIYPKLPGVPKFLLGSHFRRSLFLFLSIKSVDCDVFMEKLGKRLDLIRNCATIKDHLLILKQIYNWNNRNPIAIIED